MIIKIASVLILLCANTPVKGSSHFRTAVAIKEAIQDFSHPIPIEVDSYIDLVRKSKLFVDTTLLIDDFVKMDLKPWLIVGPRKIGKTVNLDMLRTFFEIQVDLYGNRILPLNSTLTYKLFAGGQITLEHGKVEKLHEPLLISSHNSLIKDHLGKVPVIYVNFKDVTGQNYTEIEQHLRHAIGRAFEHHLYMINVLQKISQREPAKKSDLIRFKNIISENDQDDFKTSICFLSQLLSENFGRKPVIIFDDYDVPVTNTLSVKDFNDQDLNMVLKTIDTINYNTFQNNQHYWKAIVCGTFELEQIAESSTWDNFILQDIIAKKDPSSFYFGFTHKDARDLLEKCQIHADQLKQAHHWYGGYKASHSHDVFYNPHSIANFLKEKKIGSYFKLKQVQPILHKFVERKSPHTFALISKQTIAISSQIKINPNYLSFMKVPEGVSRCGYLWYLYRLGYLTYHNTSNTEFIHIKIPNNEIAMEMSHWLISHYQQQYGIKESILKDAANHLLQIVHNASSEAKPLEDSLTQLYNKCIIPDINENSVQTIFNGIALEMQCLSKFLIDVYYNKILKADLVIAQSDIKHGGIINVRYDNNQVDNETSRLAESYERVFETVNYELNTLILLAVEVTPTKPIQVSVKLKRKPIALSTKTTISSNVVTKSNIDDPIVVQLPDNKRKKVKISISLQIQTSK